MTFFVAIVNNDLSDSFAGKSKGEALDLACPDSRDRVKIIKVKAKDPGEARIMAGRKN